MSKKQNDCHKIIEKKFSNFVQHLSNAHRNKKSSNIQDKQTKHNNVIRTTTFRRAFRPQLTEQNLHYHSINRYATSINVCRNINRYVSTYVSSAVTSHQQLHKKQYEDKYTFIHTQKY